MISGKMPTASVKKMQMDTALDFLEIPMAQCGMGNAQLTLSGQERQRGMKQTSMEGAL